MAHFEFQTRIPAPAGTVFDWHARPGAFTRLIPPWEDVRLVSQTGGIEDGGRVELELRVGPVRRRWIAEHSDYQSGHSFVDRQVKGPFAEWTHSHTVVPDGTDACLLHDSIDYRLPAGPIGRMFGAGYVRTQLQRTFAYRHETTLQDVLMHARYQDEARLRVLVTGASGLVGTALVALLQTGGHDVFRLVRSPTESTSAHDPEISWDPAAGTIDKARLEGFDAVVHLAGENIGEGRWTADKKRRIHDSRAEGTRLLAETLAQLDRPPRVLISASAIGFYGDRGAELVDETSSAGTGFLPDVCQDWEAASVPAQDAGIRVAKLRFGVILTPAGGALEKMLLPFKMGGGGVIGSGRQYWSWVGLDDVLGAIHHAIMTEGLAGPVNVVAPHPATNREFTKTLGSVLHRPTIVPLPSFAARLALGEMGDELILASTRVSSQRLEDSQYQFRYPQLDAALQHVLGKS